MSIINNTYADLKNKNRNDEKKLINQSDKVNNELLKKDLRNFMPYSESECWYYFSKNKTKNPALLLRTFFGMEKR